MEELPDLPSDVASAVYALVAEAVRNVHRHASAQQCRVTMRVHSDTLVVTISDDGVGIEPDVSPGVGLVSMQERATGLGGDVTVARAPGTASGTVVEARIPVAAAVQT